MSEKIETKKAPAKKYIEQKVRGKQIGASVFSDEAHKADCLENAACNDWDVELLDTPNGPGAAYYPLQIVKVELKEEGTEQVLATEPSPAQQQAAAVAAA